jgi:hypothetical protein
VFTARYALSPYIKQIRFVFKGLISISILTSLLSLGLPSGPFLLVFPTDPLGIFLFGVYQMRLPSHFITFVVIVQMSYFSGFSFFIFPSSTYTCVNKKKGQVECVAVANLAGPMCYSLHHWVVLSLYSDFPLICLLFLYRPQCWHDNTAC